MENFTEARTLVNIDFVEKLPENEHGIAQHAWLEDVLFKGFDGGGVYFADRDDESELTWVPLSRVWEIVASDTQPNR